MIFGKNDKDPQPRYNEQELMIRLKVFIGAVLALTLFGIVFVVLYSLIFVVQPLGAISPIDQKFFELIIPIATFLTGTLSGIMLAGNSKEDKEFMMDAQKKAMENFEDTKKAMLTPVATVPTNFSTTSRGKSFMSEMGCELEDGDPPVRNTRND